MSTVLYSLGNVKEINGFEISSFILSHTDEVEWVYLWIGIDIENKLQSL